MTGDVLRHRTYGGRVQVDVSTYQNDMTTFHSRDDILAMLIHFYHSIGVFSGCSRISGV